MRLLKRVKQMKSKKTSSLFIAQSTGLLSVVYIIREKSKEDVQKVLAKKYPRSACWSIYSFVDPGRCGQAIKLGDK